MTQLLIASYVIQAIMLLALLVLAIIVYRAKRTVGFLLLMLAVICYFIEWFTPYLVTLAIEIADPRSAAAITAWVHSWWFTVGHTFGLLSLGLITVAFVFLARESRRLSHDRPNQATQPTDSRRTASHFHD